MNNCILMAEISQEPQLRFTSDTQTALAEMLVQFPGLRAEDPPATLKVVGWGNLAQEIQQNYHQGDRVIIEGRLSMNTVQLDGFKEKRAELTVQRIHALGEGVTLSSSSSSTGESAQSSEQSRSSAAKPTINSSSFTTGSSRNSQIEERSSGVGVLPKSDSEELSQSATYPTSSTEADVDDIPF